MARIASIILTKEGKKAKLAELNESIKAVKFAMKAHAVAVKENDNTLKAATKEHAGVAKALEKEAATLAKELATFEAQKSALVNDTSVGAAAPARSAMARRCAGRPGSRRGCLTTLGPRRNGASRRQRGFMLFWRGWRRTTQRRRGGMRMEIKLTADRRRSCRALFYEIEATYEH